jgi:EAL domain-containing protein (putative c-di-GMP-specific phosphodiesterase class I)
MTARPDVGLDGAPHLVFQPAVDLTGGRLLGFEALLRWIDPSGAFIPPDALIPWAEDHGYMSNLNAWVLSEACAQAARWPSSLQVAVNCSVFQLRRGEAAVAAASALEHSGLSADRLTVEITETSIDDDEAAADLHAMARLGVQLTLDDVESDWLILASLRDVVVSTIKLDGVVIEGLTSSEGGANQAIVETIVKLSRSLGISTVAEAVETGRQVAILRELGVDVAQGYFFSPPLPSDDAYTLAVKTPPASFVVDGPFDEPITGKHSLGTNGNGKPTSENGHGSDESGMASTEAMKEKLDAIHNRLTQLIAIVQLHNDTLDTALEIRPGNIWITDFDPADDDLAEVDLAEVDLTEVDLAQVDAPEVDSVDDPVPTLDVHIIEDDPEYDVQPDPQADSQPDLQSHDELAEFQGLAPGWYRDPANPGLARHWDGTTLSEERRPIASSPEGEPEGS